jgi:amidase
MPAHFCGVFGLKPTLHRVPTAGMALGPPGTPRLDRDMGVCGPLARTAEDLALVLSVIAGPHPRDLEVPPVPFRPVPRLEPRDLRIALLPVIPGIACTAEIHDALTAAGRTLAAAGARVEEATLPFAYDELLTAFRRFLPILFASLIRLGLAPPGTPVPEVGATPDDLYAALDVRDRLAAALDRFLGDYDALICPVSIATALPHRPPGRPFDIDIDGAPVSSRNVDHACLIANLTGHPAASVPIALGRGGLPIGSQLLAPRWRDEHLLGVAATLSALVGPLPPPPDPLSA